MVVSSESAADRVTGEARPEKPVLLVTVSPGVARFLLAAASRPVSADGSLTAGPGGAAL